MGSKVQRTPGALTKRAPRRINARAKTIGTNINKCGSHLGKSESVSPGRLNFLPKPKLPGSAIYYTLYTSRNTKNLCTFGRTKALFLPMAANFPSHSILTSPSQKERNPDGRPGKTKTQTYISSYYSAPKIPNHSDTRARSEATRAKRSRLKVSFPAHELGGCSTLFIRKKKYLFVFTSRGVSGQPSRGPA